MNAFDLVVAQRLLLAALLTGLIGYERERHGRAAGLRTHLLVGIGSALIVLTALHIMTAMAGRVTVDPTRMAAHVMSGIGFLGAGTIMRFRASVRGLTTAASLWVAAGIGLAVGSGFLFGAVIATLIVLAALFGLLRIEHGLRRDWYQSLVVETASTGQELGGIRRVLSDHDMEIRDLDITPSPQRPGVSVVTVTVKMLSIADRQEVINEVLRIEGTQSARWVS